MCPLSRRYKQLVIKNWKVACKKDHYVKFMYTSILELNLHYQIRNFIETANNFLM